MSSIPYINPLSPVQIGGTISVPRDVNFGVTYSTNLIGGYMEVDTLSNLTYTIPSGTSGLTQFSGNSIPISFVKGNGSAYSPDVLFLNNDNISSGRRKIGMLVFVRDQGQIYQYNIDGYDTLWNSATAATGTVSVSYLGTTVNNTTVAGQNFINAWTASTIDGVGGYTASNAKWKKYYGTNLALTGGSFNSITGTLTLTNITGGTQSLTGFGSGGGISGDYLPLSGGTVTGGTIFTGGLTANTISATTYYNLPLRVSGTGTQDYVTKWDSSTIGLVDSQIYDNGSFVGIGTTTQVFSEGLNVTNGGIFNRYGMFDITGNLSIGIVDYDTSVWGAIDSIAIGVYGTMANSISGPNIAIGGASLTNLTTGNGNISIGDNASNSVSTGNNNVIIGNEAFTSSNSGDSSNVAIGHQALNVVNGANNVSIGTSSSNNVQGSGNTIFGTGASNFVNGNKNIIIGYFATTAVTSSNRLYIGQDQKIIIYGDFDNRRVGINTNSPITTFDVSGNTRINGILSANTISATTYQNLPFSGTVGGTGTSNYVTKWSDGVNVTDSLIYDTGAFVGIGTTTPIYSEPISFQTGNKGITIDSLYIQENGNGSLAFATGFDYNSWGTNGSEIAIGTRGPLENSTGSGNIGIGDKALNGNTTGTNNIAIGGTSTLFNNNTGAENTAIGNNSLQFNNGGQQNVSIGNDSLFNNINGDRNTILGHSAGYTNLGSNNVYLGYSAGYSNDGSDNIFIGYIAGYGDTSSSNKLNIGDTIIGDLSAKSISVPTISATTYQNLPSQSGTGVASLSYITTTGILTLTKNDTTTLTAGTFTYITGGSYSNNIVTLTNNLGGNSTLTINTLTGLTVNGGLTVTTISATTYQNLPFSGTVTGSGTTRYIPSWNGTSSLSNTIIYNATDKIGINTSSPLATLHVSGGTIISGNLTVTGTTSSPTFTGNSLTLSSSASTIYLNNTTAQQIKFYDAGRGTPTYNSYSSGAKIIFSDNISSISSGYAIGVDAGSLWYGVDLAGNGHDWYAGTNKIASLISSAGFQLFGLGSVTTAAFTISGTSSLGSKGGLGYMDFLRVYNNYPSATNPNKWFRTTSGGTLQILRDDYNATIFDLTNSGVLSVGGGNIATSTSQDATSNYLSFNSNGSQIYDDGNMHIHSRSANQSMWINTNNGQINIGVQSPVAGGGIASAVAFATGTVNGYMTINTGKTITTAAAYGYLTTGGAGTYPGGSQTISISLYANNRIWGQEIDAFSDERMKDIHGEITLEEGIKLVKNLKPIKYNWKEGDDKGIKAGYSAQQVIKSGFDHLIGLIPTEGLEETIDDDGFLSPKDTQFAMNYDQVTPYHGVVIKHLLEKIEQLENRIKDLENK